MAPKRKRDRRRWYSISVDTLRLLVFPGVVLMVVVVGWLGFGLWQEYRVERRTTEVMAQVEVLVEQLATREVKEKYRPEYESAWAKFQQASSAVEADDYRTALPLAVESRDALLALRNALGGGSQDAQFVAVEGGVEFRRGERGRWQPARGDVLLQPGDYVRTSVSGSAEIYFPDGTFFVVRKNSQVIISHALEGSGETGKQMEMEYGWVNLSTSKTPGKVRTPDAEAQVDSDSEVFLSYERSSGKGRFGAIRGGMVLRPDEGEPQRIGEHEQVVQTEEGVSDSFPLPRAPSLLYPPDRFEINSDQTDELTLTWEPVAGSTSYALQVSDNHLFGHNIVEDMDRTKTSALLGIHGEGSFMWQVAARGADESLGPWSQWRRFRVVSLASRATIEDQIPPPLEITSVRPYGNLYIVRGKTESGAILSVNGIPVSVQADGTFNKTVELRVDGAAVIEIVARDAWGNEAVARESVFVESP